MDVSRVSINVQRWMIRSTRTISQLSPDTDEFAQRYRALDKGGRSVGSTSRRPSQVLSTLSTDDGPSRCERPSLSS